MLRVFNSIVWGSYSDEVRTTGKGTLDIVSASHSLFKWTKNRPVSSARWEEILYTDPLLENPAKLNVELKTDSPARGSGYLMKQEGMGLYDLKGRKRIHPDGTVDRGALVYEEKSVTN